MEPDFFSDEKKFNLDGPDEYKYYWHDLRKEKKIFSKRHSGGGSVIIWGAFSYKGTSDLVAVKGRLNSIGYSRILEGLLIPMNTLLHDGNAIFQQDNAPIHTSRMMREWFDAFDLLNLEWPAYSPDLNPIENLWGWMARKVYGGGRQFKNREALLECVMKCWSEIDPEYLQNLVTSMKSRCLSVIKSKGGRTDYYSLVGEL